MKLYFCIRLNGAINQYSYFDLSLRLYVKLWIIFITNQYNYFLDLVIDSIFIHRKYIIISDFITLIWDKNYGRKGCNCTTELIIRGPLGLDALTWQHIEYNNNVWCESRTRILTILVRFPCWPSSTMNPEFNCPGDHTHQIWPQPGPKDVPCQISIHSSQRFMKRFLKIYKKNSLFRPLCFLPNKIINLTEIERRLGLYDFITTFLVWHNAKYIETI